MPVAVTVTVYKPVLALLGMLIFRVDVPDPPADSVMVLGFSEVLGSEGEEVTSRLMVPLKPPRLVRPMLDVADEPCWIVRDDGLAVMLKSTTWTLTVVVCESGPLEAVMVTV